MEHGIRTRTMGAIILARKQAIQTGALATAAACDREIARRSGVGEVRRAEPGRMVRAA